MFNMQYIVIIDKSIANNELSILTVILIKSKPFSIDHLIQLLIHLHLGSNFGILY